MTEPRHCQDCGRAPVVSYEFPNNSLSKGRIHLVCPSCYSSTPHFDSYREALTNWNLKQISAEEVYALKQRHRAELKEELKEEIREELKEEIIRKLQSSATYMIPTHHDVIYTISNM